MRSDEWERIVAQEPGNVCAEAALTRARIREGLEPGKVRLGSRRFVAIYAGRVHLVLSLIHI